MINDNKCHFDRYFIDACVELRQRRQSDALQRTGFPASLPQHSGYSVSLQTAACQSEQRRMVFTRELCEMFLCRGILSPHPLLHFSPPKHKCGAGFSLAWANIRGALGPLPRLQTPPGITRMPKPCVGCMFSLNKWQNVQAGNRMQSDDPGGTQRLLQYDEDASLFQCFLRLKTLRLNTELLLIAIMWQGNLVPGGILGLISVWYMFCLLTAVFGWKSQMNVCSKEDWWAGGWWAAGLQTLIWMGCWHSWIPSCRDLANSQRYREEKQKSPDWVGSSAESCKFLPHCISKEAPTHWPLLLECYTGQFMLSLPVQLGLYNVNVLVMKQMLKWSVRSHHTQFNLVGVFYVCAHWAVH